MATIDLLLSEEDRERLGAPEVLLLDLERVRDTPARMLIRWERDCGYSIERAIGEMVSGGAPPAAATTVCVWLARKQMGADGGGQDDDGQDEPFSALADLRTIRVGTRWHRDEPEGDALPPDGSPASSSES